MGPDGTHGLAYGTGGAVGAPPGLGCVLLCLMLVRHHRRNPGGSRPSLWLATVFGLFAARNGCDALAAYCPRPDAARELITLAVAIGLWTCLFPLAWRLASDRSAARYAETNHNLRRLQSLMDHCPVIACIKDAETGRYVYGNKEFLRFFGACNLEELVGKTDADLFEPALAADLQRRDVAALRAGRPVHYEEDVPHGSGVRHYRSVKFPIYNGSPRRLIGVIATDQTAERKEKDQLEARVVRLQLQCERLADALAIQADQACDSAMAALDAALARPPEA
jgi:PAS domain S-box-containing protein